jgi:hypothetical protein
MKKTLSLVLGIFCLTACAQFITNKPGVITNAYRFKTNAPGKIPPGFAFNTNAPRPRIFAPIFTGFVFTNPQNYTNNAVLNLTNVVWHAPAYLKSGAQLEIHISYYGGDLVRRCPFAEGTFSVNITNLNYAQFIVDLNCTAAVWLRTTNLNLSTAPSLTNHIDCSGYSAP